jgi:hypothetical protein
MEVCATTEPADTHIDGLIVRCHLVDPLIPTHVTPTAITEHGSR